MEPFLDVILTEIGESRTTTAPTCCWILKTCCINYCDDWMVRVGHISRSWQCSACTKTLQLTTGSKITGYISHVRQDNYMHSERCNVLLGQMFLHKLVLYVVLDACLSFIVCVSCALFFWLFSMLFHGSLWSLILEQIVLNLANL